MGFPSFGILLLHIAWRPVRLPSMNENAQKWVHALRSGKYKQGESYLARRDEDGQTCFCCLGVACALAIEEGLPVDMQRPTAWGSVFLYDGEGQFMPGSVRQWLGLSRANGLFDVPESDAPSLTDMNDRGDSFAEIAEFIESEPKGLFE